jgi:hypothetical protein
MASMTRASKTDAAEGSSRRNNPSRASSYTSFNAGNAANRDRGHNINHVGRGIRALYTSCSHAPCTLRLQLMGFSLPPRLAPPTSSQTPVRRAKRGGGHHIPFNKERYVNAQYRFLVKPTGDYTAYFADSDIYLNWSDILTVLIPTSSALSTASDVNGLYMSQQPSLERHEGAACPICLSPPTAPRMTKCGHVFCYPCILHYLTIHEAASGASTPSAYHQHVPGSARSVLPSLNASASSPPKWKRCPICWDAVYARDLKAVRWWDAKARAVEYERSADAGRAKENHLCMRLIERPHLTTLALPQSSTWPSASTSTLDQPLIAQHSAPWHFQPDVMTFCKFMLATPSQLLDNLNGNLNELKEEKSLLQSFGMKDEVGLYFVDVAERKVHEQMEKVMNELDTSSVQSRIGYAKNELKEHAEIERGIRERNEEAISKREKKRREREKKTEEAGAEDDANVAVADFLQVQADKQGVSQGDKASHTEGDLHPRKDASSNVPKSRRNLNPPAPLSSSYLFFQASSGQNVFLHPLDIKVLLSVFGSYAAFPRTLQVPVQGVDEGSMNEEIQKKCKYLNHLTKGTDIVFIEVDWDSLVREDEAQEGAFKVDQSVLRLYDQALKQRRNRRNDRERREDRAKAKWEETQKTTSGRPIGMATGGRRSLEESRSPTLSATEDLFPSSLGSASTSSPSFRQAALFGSDQVYPIHPGPVSAEDEFPATTLDRDVRRDETIAAPRDIQSSNAARRTVWGTPAARIGTFATALHNSSRNGETADEDAPDWDTWLELEEDYIVGARNGTSVREGRGLNRQAKKGAAGDSSSEGTKPDERQSVPGAPPPKNNAKQQKKKTLVLTSGGGGRRR